MDGMEALVAIVFAMVPIAMRFIARYYRLREKQLMLLGEPSPRRIERLVEEKRLLEQRVENLESIICSVDYELNRRLHRLASAAAPPRIPPTAGGLAAALSGPSVGGARPDAD
jgi:hypothetical protein